MSLAQSNILVDTIPISPGKVGVRIYLRELLDAIPRERRASIHLLCTKSNAHLYSDLEGYHAIFLPWSTGKRPVRVVTQQLIVPLIAVRLQADVVFEPVDHAAILTPVPIVTSMHSSHINLHHGQMQGLRKWYNSAMLKVSARRSQRLIAISGYVKETLIDLLGVDPGRIDVVHHGGGMVARARRNGWGPPQLEARDGGILFVSSLHPHKNVDVLIRSYATLREQMPEVPPLVIVGKDVNGERARLEGLTEELGVASSVHFEGRVSDERLLELLGSARLMVYPSELEGFGLPAVEAMQAGIPLIASDQASVPEIVGDGGQIVSPDEPRAMAEAMEKVLTDPQTAESLVATGAQRGKHFSWERTARQTLDVIDRAAKM